MKKVLILLLLSYGAVSGQSKLLTLESLFKVRNFQQQYVYGLNSLKDGKSYAAIIRDAKTGLLKVVRNNYTAGKTIETIYTEKDLIFGKDTLPVSTNFSADERKVLITTAEEQIYRHSSKASYFVYDLASKKISPVSGKGKQLFASFSPDGSKVAFVRGNNIFIKDLSSNTEKQITADGKENRIINGWSDWVYEEEFAFAKAFFWSPDSKRIAYYKFDETEVPQYSMTVFESLYPSQYTYKYPKAGEKNSLVSIHCYSLVNNKTITVNIGAEKDQYIPRVKWTASSASLCVLRMNRHQNKLEYLLADAAAGTSKVILTEQDKYYIDLEKEKLSFLSDGKHFINTSERDGFNHLYLYDLDGKIVKQLTKGNWEVTEVYGTDESKGIVYYQSTEQSPLCRDVYSVSLTGSSKKRLSTRQGTNSAEFSADFSYYILSNTTINTPLYITLHSETGQEVRVLESNEQLSQRLASYNLSAAEFFSFKTSEGIDLNGYMIKPDNFSPQKKYPVLLYVYGGPGSQEAANSWEGTRLLWFKMLAQKGYIVACADNRGTGFRGAEFQKTTYKQLGKLETADQIETAKWFAKQNYADASRIGIWGWSYGGYMSSLCAVKGNGIFKMAIAVAPVTTWRYYDTIYTERFLQTPQENPKGYDENSPVQFADQLQGKFLLVHGTGDDNVHFQNSILFSEALIQANKPFEQAYYPNKNHRIYGGNTTLHLYSRLTDFIYKNL